MTELVKVLTEARDLGFLGPGPVTHHITHAEGFAEAGELDDGVRVADLGSGGGVPGLVLALVLRGSTWWLIDSNQRRTAFLRRAVDRLALGVRVRVWEGRAEDAGRDAGFRGCFDAVVARGFGAPAVTAECGCPLLRVEGRLIVSEPPESDGSRWQAEGLATLGARSEGVRSAGGTSFEVITQAEPCPAAFPRRVGVPAKRPLF